MSKFKAPQRAETAQPVYSGPDVSFWFSDNLDDWHHQNVSYPSQIKRKGGDKTRTLRKLNNTLSCAEKYLYV